jgi:DivIVA domain-containing protein
MLRPADIEDRDFLVVVHGYHKGEVRDFLATIAAEYADLLTKAEAPANDAGDDDFESMGSQIAGVLRAAKEAAATMTTEAEEHVRHVTAQAETTRAEAERAAEEVMAAAESIRAEATREADELRTAAEAALADARRQAADLRAEAEATLADARETARRLEQEAHERARAHEIEAEAGVRTRLDALQSHEGAIRGRLEELGDALRNAAAVLDGAHHDGHVDLADATVA